MSNNAGCNVCGGTHFRDVGARTKAICTGCGSYERTRLLWMYLKPLIVSKSMKILHFAPEKGLYRAIKNLVDSENYVCADIDRERYSWVDRFEYVDMCSLENFPNEQFDLIIHSHVLEHVPCNYAYPLYHIHRMLTSDGRHVCVIPFLSGHYDEQLGVITEPERTRRFGQFDHVRRFGREDIRFHLASVLNLPQEFDAEQDFGPELLQKNQIPKKSWWGFTTDTVLVLKKYDMKFLRV